MFCRFFDYPSACLIHLAACSFYVLILSLFLDLSADFKSNEIYFQVLSCIAVVEWRVKYTVLIQDTTVLF